MILIVFGCDIVLYLVWVFFGGVRVYFVVFWWV